jgi:two-component system phosphate regulon sensor histidine kinase PhoR
MKKLWTNSLVAKIFFSYLAIVALLFGSFYFATSTQLRNFYISSLNSRMEQQAHLLARVLPFGVEGKAMDDLCRQLSHELGARITVIATEGKVLGDSSEVSANMENHAGRPEIVAALSQGSGSSLRYSTTVRYEMLYRAFHQIGNGEERIIRVAMPLTDVENVISSVRHALLIGLLFASALGLLVALAFSRHLSRRIKRLVDFSRELAGGSFPQNFFPARGKDEIHRLEQHLNEMGQEIRDNITQVVAEKEKLDSILRCMMEGVLVLDPKGRVLVINDQAIKMFHVPPDRDIHGASIAELSRHPEMRKMIQEVLASDIGSRSFTKEMELEEGRWFRINAVGLRHGEQGVLGSILVFHDITEIKRLETIRSDFVANVSHELRTPLTAIRGYVETLLYAPPPDPQDSRQFLAIIDRHSERLTRLTDDLLTLSDLESGRAQLSLAAVDPSQLIQRVLEIFLDRAEKKQVELCRVIEVGALRIMGDLDRLQQLFINLVDNAVKYTPPGGRVTITASTKAAANGRGPRIEIAVSDTGPGIPAKDLPRLTERFFRVDKTRSRELGGTGLGLAIVKHIVQAHQGELKIESQVQKGTTVRVMLPAAPEIPRPKSVLFLCTGNSCRSQMAEAFARQLAAEGCVFYSAGTAPRDIHPLAIQVMKEVGIDITGQRSKGLGEIPLGHVDLLITLCGDAAETCPSLPANIERRHWPLRDPALAEGSREEILKVFREVRDQIRGRVEALLAGGHSLREAASSTNRHDAFTTMH